MDKRNSRLQAGFDKRSISPSLGAPLAGFAARTGVCEGVHDELYARALVIDTGLTAVALVSLDLLAVDSDFVEQTRRAIAEKVPLERPAILISATHTHAGPVTVRAFFNPDQSLDAGFMARLRTAIVEAVEAAWQRRFPASIGVGTVSITDLGVNRRSPDGLPVDNEVGLVKIDDHNGRTRAVLINYGCHPTVLGPDNLLASGDFPAMAIDHVESKLGNNSFAMFINGAQGDISVGHSSELSAIGVIAPGRTFERAKELGYRLADIVLNALPSVAASDDVLVRFATLNIDLPLKSYPPPQQTAQSLDKALERIARLETKGTSPEYHQAKSDLLYSSIAHFYAQETSQCSAGKFPIELQAIEIDGSVLIAVPAEVFAEVGLRIKASDSRHALLAGITNGYIGYLPSRRAFAEGGYEVVSSKCNPDAEDRLVEGVARLREMLI